MGCDVHIVLGRINLTAIAARPSGVSNSTALALFNQANIEVEDFTLEEVPEEYDLWRNYSLFSWLGVTGRGDLRPYYEGDERQDNTRAFLEWLDRKLIEKEKTENSQVGKWYGGTSSLFDKYYFGDHSFILFGVKPLLEFDYDEVVERRNDDFDWNNPTYYRDTEGKTYRQCFGDHYFKFLNYCQNENWHFIVFGFDS